MGEPLYKTTIIIWSEYDPQHQDMEISDIAAQAIDGDAYCSFSQSELVEDPLADPYPPSMEFFSQTFAEELECEEEN